MVTPERPAFRTGLRGYDRAEVDAHLEQTAAELEHARRQVDQLRGERDAAREQLRRLEEAEHTVPLRGTVDPHPTDPLTAGSSLRRPATPLPHPRPPGPHRRSRRWSRLVPLLLLVALAPALLWWLVSRDDQGPTDRVAATAPSASATAVPSASASVAPPSPTPAPARTAAAAPLPDGWTTHRGGGGAWTVGIPPGWRTAGGGEEQGFVSASGLTRMWVRTTEVGADADPAALLQLEQRFAAENPGYERRSVTAGEHRGSPAATWEYEHGSGPDRRRGQDLGVLVDGRAYWLHVESRASAWRFAVPLVEGFRETFVPA